MEFLKAFFGDKAITYDELVQAINAYNGDEKNKEKLIKMVNLTDGGYVSKDKYTNLETDLSGKTTELTKANNLIEELKKSAGKDEETQQKITAYETEIADLKKENAELKTENALKFALVAAGAVDVDYLVFKAKEKGEIRETLDTSVLAKNLMSVSISMLNLKFEEADMKFVFSDMRMQFEQYYLLIKK